MVKQCSRSAITRRHFVAAAVAGPTILASGTFGRGVKAAPNDRVALACIGAGGQGAANMNQFLHDERVEIVAVCDVDERHRARALEITGLPHSAAYTNYEDVLARGDVDAVSIGTPDHWHAIITIAAAKAGKDIFCEKPLSLTVREGRAMADAVGKHERILQTGTWRRSRPACRRACELVRNGYIGALKHVNVYVPEGFAIRGGDFAGPQPAMAIPKGFDYDRWLGPAPDAPYTEGRCHFNFRWILDYSAGYITDWGAHYYDVAQWGMDMDASGPAAIEGKAEFPPTDHLYNAQTKHHIEWQYENGVKLISDTTTDGSKYGVHFTGSEGWIYVENSELKASSPAIELAELGPDAIRLYESDNHHANFIDCIHSRNTPAAPVEAAHRAATLCHLGSIATLVGRPLHWDAKHERLYGDDEANAMLSRESRGKWAAGVV
jgi:predicted dehydrogenase